MVSIVFVIAMIATLTGAIFLVWLGRAAGEQAEADERDRKRVAWFPWWPNHQP